MIEVVLLDLGVPFLDGNVSSDGVVVSCGLLPVDVLSVFPIESILELLQAAKVLHPFLRFLTYLLHKSNFLDAKIAEVA